MVQLFKFSVGVRSAIFQRGAEHFPFTIFKLDLDQPTGYFRIQHLGKVLKLCPVPFRQGKGYGPFPLPTLGEVLYLEPPVFFQAHTELDTFRPEQKEKSENETVTKDVNGSEFARATEEGNLYRDRVAQRDRAMNRDQVKAVVPDTFFPFPLTLQGKKHSN